MADVKLRVLTEDQASRVIKQIDKELADLGKTAEKTGKAGKKGNKEFIDSLKTIGLTAGAVVGSVAAFGVAAKKAFDLGKEGAAINQTTESFDGLLDQLNIAPGYLDRLREASNDTIDDMSLMSSTLTLVAGSSDSMAKSMLDAAPRLMEIAKAANKLNPALGSTSFMYESLMTGIKRSSPMILDNLGIIIKVGDANEKYAESIGKTVNALSAEEQKIALLNAALESGGQLIKQAGGTAESAADSYAQLEVSFSNLSNSLKSDLAPALADVVDGLNAVFSIGDEGKNLKDTWVDVEIGIRRVMSVLDASNYAHARRVEVLKASKDAEKSEADAIKELAWSYGVYKDAMMEVNNVERATVLTRREIISLYRDLTDANIDFQYSMGMTAQNVDYFKMALVTTQSDISETGDVLSDAADEAIEFKSALDRLNNIDMNLSSTIMNDLKKIDYDEAGYGEIQDYTDRLSAGLANAPADSIGHIQHYKNEMGEALVAATALDVVTGRATSFEGAQTLKDALGLEDAKATLEEAVALVEKLGIDQYLNIYVTEHYTSSKGGGRGGTKGAGAKTTEQAGDYGFTVPPGYNNDSYLMGLTSGERVEVTTQSGSQGGKQAEKGAKYTYEFNIMTNDPLAVANEVVTILNSQQRAAGVAGANYTGM